MKIGGNMWVLIITVIFNGRVAVQQVDFKTENACITARDQFRSQWDNNWGLPQSANPYQAICVKR